MMEIYPDLQFPPAGEERPYLAINMVATIDGKIVTGNRDEPVQDLGSKLDHQTMRVIQAAVDGIMIGAGTLRSTPKLWYPADKSRFVVTGSGNVDPDCRFFSDAPERAYAVTTLDSTIPEPLQTVRAGSEEIDFRSILHKLRLQLGIHHLLVEGGSDLNSSLFRLDLVDEIFLTLAPKIKLGADVPTIADGIALPREQIQSWSLITAIAAVDEVFLRYRRIDRGETR